MAGVNRANEPGRKDLLLVIGPPAVGKMTVGRALSELTGFPLLHNHLSIELALRFFDFGTEGFRRISSTIRETVFRTVRDSELPGLIFTFVWAFDLEEDRRYVETLTASWREQPAGRVYCLELAASEAAKQTRNRHEERLLEKPSKRDLERSEQLRTAHESRHRFASRGAFPLDCPHVCIDNTELPPEAAAQRFLDAVGLG